MQTKLWHQLIITSRTQLSFAVNAPKPNTLTQNKISIVNTSQLQVAIKKIDVPFMKKQLCIKTTKKQFMKFSEMSNS